MVASTLWLQASLDGNQSIPHDARLLPTYPRYCAYLEVPITDNVCCSTTYGCRLCRRREQFLRGCTGHVGSLQVIAIWIHAPPQPGRVVDRENGHDVQECTFKLESCTIMHHHCIHALKKGAHWWKLVHGGLLCTAPIHAPIVSAGGVRGCQRTGKGARSHSAPMGNPAVHPRWVQQEGLGAIW